MRHSILTDSKNYYKIVDDDENNNKKYDVEESEEIKNKLLYCENKAKYEENLNNDKSNFDKKRYDVIYNLNKKGTTPKDSTIKKYNLKFDDTKKTLFLIYL